MKQKRITQRVLIYESLGFAILIAVSWLNELIGLPALIFGQSVHSNLHEAVLETVIILAAAAPTLWATRRLVQRLVYLEGFLHVCAWCRKIHVEDKWMGLETYLATELDTKTSHAICPECAARMERES